MMLIDHLSVSRRKTFRQCSQQYKFRYHTKTPRPGEEPIYFIYGKLIHKAAEVYVKNKGKQSIGDIAQEIMRGKILVDEKSAVIPKLTPEYLRKLPKHLRAVQKITEQIGFDGDVEWPFEYDLDPPNKKLLVGFVDRLIIRGDKAYVIDYKTTKKGKYRVNKSTVLHDDQLKIYSRMVQKFFDIKPENIKSSLFFLEGEELVAASFSDVSLTLLEADYKDEFYTIESADPNKVWGNVGHHCKWCDYCTICPFYKPLPSKAEAWDGTMENL